MAFGLFHDDFPFYRLFRVQWAILNRAMSLLHAVLTDLKDLAARCGQIHALATEAIGVSKEILRELSLTMIRPVDRQDVYELNQAFGDTMRAVRAAATRAGLYNLPAPRSPVPDIAANLLCMVQEVGGILDGLRTLTPFSLQEEKLDEIREETRILFLVGLGELYEGKVETVQDLMEAMKWAQIFDRLEETFEKTEEIAGAVRGIILKNL
jgi:uncharacterized protein